MKKNTMSRRDFFKGATAGVLTFPTIIPSTVLGKDGAVAPSNRVTMGAIGTGTMGTTNIKNFLTFDDVQIVALCDVDKNHRDEVKGMVDKCYGNTACATYNDFRELLSRRDLDTVMLALPEHWHAIPAIAAARAGLDIYGEKPLAHSVREGRAIIEAVQQHGRIWQTGSWQRSQANFRFAAELVINGRIGKVSHVEVGLHPGQTTELKTGGASTDDTMSSGREPLLRPEPIPPELDYDLWVGPAPWSPYRRGCVHKNWRFVRDFGGGTLTDWIGHHADIAHWGLGLDETGPVEISGSGEYPASGLFNTLLHFNFTCKYASGVEINVSDKNRGGTRWYGDKGWVYVTRGGLNAEPRSLLKEVIQPGEIHLYNSSSHYRNFVDCVKTRQPTITPVEVAQRSVSVGLLGDIAMTTGRTIKWNPEKEEIIGDPSASALLGRAYRDPWQL